LRYLIAALTVSAILFGARAPQSQLSLADQIPVAEARVTKARPRTIAEAEAEGATYPRATSAVAGQGEPRTCLVVKPERIVLPQSQGGDPRDRQLVFGDFFALSISFGWGPTYEIAKLPLEPLVVEPIGKGLLIRVVRLDPPDESTTYELRDLNLTNPRRPFFPSWPRFPTPGRWMVIATAGANWGCFVLNRPEK
jgi:hypothetical protein